MGLDDFRHWLDRYGRAWVEGDPEAAVRLFSNTAAYHEVPFEAPMVGTEAIRRYWTDGAKNGQANVVFEATPTAFAAGTGHAHWHATFTRVPAGTFVELDGVLMARFDEDMRCTEFREWWHRKET